MIPQWAKLPSNIIFFLDWTSKSSLRTTLETSTICFKTASEIPSLTLLSLEEKKQTLNSEIEQLNGEAIKIKGTPKTYPAGHLTAGTDIPVGRYKIYGGNSNFIVYSSAGKLEVNIILGESFGVNEYIYTFKSGDKIEANSSFKLVEVE